MIVNLFDEIMYTYTWLRHAGVAQSTTVVWGCNKLHNFIKLINNI